MPTKEPRYYVAIHYQGFNGDKDDRITKAVGRESGGMNNWTSGEGERDLGFSFYYKSAALKAAKRARRLHRVRASVLKLDEL